MNRNISENNSLLNIFMELCKIPSPSLKEEMVSKKIIEILSSYKDIEIIKDDYGNIIGKIKATDETKNSLLLSSHLDVIGDDSKITPIYTEGNKYIEAREKRTLGADDKAGVAAICQLAIDIAKLNGEISHGGLEFVFTRDEEISLSGIKNLNFSILKSKNVIVLDADKLGQVFTSGASFTNLTINVESKNTGHSGIDISDISKLNAAKLISEIIDKIPQGVYKSDESLNNSVITSINLGSIVAGGINPQVIENFNKKDSDIIDFLADNSIVNVINKKAKAKYSIRSASVKYETELKNKIINIVDNFNNKYKNLAVANYKFEEHLKSFEENKDNQLPKLIIDTINQMNNGLYKDEENKINIKLGSFHAGAETHIYCHNENKYGQKFLPILLGIADIFNMHSEHEKINVDSYIRGYNLLKNIFFQYNKNVR